MRQRQKRAIPTLLLGIPLVSMVLLVQSDRHHMLERIDAMVSVCLYPALVLAQRITDPFMRWRQRHVSIDHLTTALQRAQATESALIAEVVQLRAAQLHQEDQQLLQQFIYRYATEHMIFAQVIARHCSDDEQVILLDAGTRRGVEQDMVVVWKNCLVGRVSAVYPHFCRVLLVTDKRCKIPIICAATKTQAIYEGMNNPAVGRLTFVSHLDKLEQGDMLFASGDGFVYPKGFAVGLVRDFSLDRQGLHYDVTVEPLLHNEDIRYAYIVQKGAEYRDESIASEEPQPL